MIDSPHSCHTLVTFLRLSSLLAHLLQAAQEDAPSGNRADPPLLSSVSVCFCICVCASACCWFALGLSSFSLAFLIALCLQVAQEDVPSANRADHPPPLSSVSQCLFLRLCLCLGLSSFFLSLLIPLFAGCSIGRTNCGRS